MMRPDMESVINILLDRSPQEWVEGIMAALFLALGLAGANMAFRRWIKATDDSTPLVGLALIAIFAGMVIATLRVHLRERDFSRPTADAGPAGGQFRGGFPGSRTSSRMAELIFENADADHDGLLSTEEAATAAATFVKQADTGAKGALDRDVLIGIIRERLRPPGTAATPPPPPPPATSVPADRPPS